MSVCRRAMIHFLVLLFAVCIVLCYLCCAKADLQLPDSLSVIDDEAFRGDSSITSVSLPDGLISIGEAAFADCGNLLTVTIPDSVSSIGNGAFDGCSEALLMVCQPDSYAVNYARDNQLDYQAGTVYRALVIGQTYRGTVHALKGPANDLNAVRSCLSSMTCTAWNVSARSNLTADAIISAVSSTFSGATKNDVSLLYYSGHGVEDGSLVGQDIEYVTPAMLKQALDQIPGRKVVVVDACYSGQLITNEKTEITSVSVALSNDTEILSNSTGDNKTEDADDAEDEENVNGAAQFISSFQSTFRRKTRGALNSDHYFVITAARGDQASGEGSISVGSSSKVMGYFTYSFCLGCGFNGVNNMSVSLAADRNGDGAVSLQEANSFAAARAATYNPDQMAVVWPSGCTWFAPFRP